MAELTHFDSEGKAQMVDVGGKQDTVREAIAAGWIQLSVEGFKKVKEGSVSKGDVLGVARIAGIMAAKKVDELIPLCHPLLIHKANIEFSLREEDLSIDIEAVVGISGKTGVEMEALTAVSVAALTIYDMCKAVDKNMTIGDIRLLKKSGGKSGVYVRSPGGS
ncbi:cyclic pyranopterin monophosphate synthase MoaC [Desulforhopalus vacuolatus]|uniref:cyclic pyranopterin monophosphate synthase MoaC n=1 Tax=Desulforhopalus vacuolatus TaxID=40414 RepID=UPI0019645953|nr:cyclic pyranopterin monophosphate synthase MoaC [Desulforhopalus vacuolatus]MBM9519566.1 cyclic pyranopterin monophosphate synthase MoaC [Desulforhopalus vacuolatus]